MKYIFIIPVVIIGFLLQGCEKALEEDPKTFISPDAFFKTAEQCTQAVNGVYTPLNDIFGQQDLWDATEIGTDLTIKKEFASVNQEYSFNPGQTGTGGLWGKSYTAIKNANLVINRLKTAPINDPLKSRLLGEAKFLRALYYFLLSNVFGDVPLWVDELNVDEVSKLGQSPLKKVREQIILDLTEAEVGLPLKYPSAADLGRVTKGAALTLLAKVYLYEKDWINAYKTAERVINDQQYSPMQNYANLFDIRNGFKNNTESIFEIQFRRDPATNNNYKTTYLYAWYMPLQDAGKSTYAGVDFGTSVLRGYELYYPTAKFVEMFEPNDNRKNVVLGYGYNGQTFNRLPKPGRPWFGSKFWDLQANDRNSGKSIYFLRYTDVLLIQAEAYNELDNLTESKKALKTLRERANLAPLNDNITKEELRQLIRNERAIEFVGEFQRRWDLVRWGILQQAVKSVSADNSVGAANVKGFHDYYPISTNEIIKNPNLKNIPDYN